MNIQEKANLTIRASMYILLSIIFTIGFSEIIKNFNKTIFVVMIVIEVTVLIWFWGVLLIEKYSNSVKEVEVKE